MKRRGFLQGLLTAFGAAVVEPVARGAEPPKPLLEHVPDADSEAEIQHVLGSQQEIDLDLWLNGTGARGVTVAYLRLKAGQRIRLRLRARTGATYVMGVRAMVPIDAIYVESIRNHQGIDLMCAGQEIDLSYFDCDDVFCPFDFGAATTEDGPVMTLVVPERCGDQELAICFFADGVSEVCWGPYESYSSQVIVPPLNLELTGPWSPVLPRPATPAIATDTLVRRVDRRRRGVNALRRFA